MQLLIDAGNTRIKWAVSALSSAVGAGSWLFSGSVSHQEFSQQPAPWHNHVHAIERALVSNVAGQALQQKISTVLAQQQISVEWFVAQASLAGITNYYQEPERLGSDRFAAAIGARALFPDQNLIIATCGTATTIDAVRRCGDFIGGMIVPGLQLMAQSLALNTAQLPHVQGESFGAAHFADHTQAAILSGCLAAQVGAIEHAVHDFSHIINADQPELPLCILSGGAARFLVPSLKIPHRMVDNLVLTGLQASLC